MGRQRRRGEAGLQVVELCAAMPRTIEDIGAEIACGRTATYRHVARAISDQLLRRHDPLKGYPALLVATDEGHRLVGSGLRGAKISPGSINHWITCSRVALQLRRQYRSEQILSEAELRLREEIASKPLASAAVGQLPSGRPRLHRPDLVIEGSDCRIAVEVELTAKAPQRLRAIIRGWRRAGCVASVIYLCAPGATHRAVLAAVRAAHAAERVEVRTLGEEQS